MTIKLHVGYVGKTRDGRRVEITDHDVNDKAYSFMSDGFEWYAESGGFWENGAYSNHDIIGPWVEPVAVKSPIETVTQNKLVDGLYGKVWVYSGHVCVHTFSIQADITAAIETLIIIRDAKVLK